ncbi:MAG: hypothetical protein WA880_11915 [Ornithinimicrobium sp.]
MYGTRQAGFSGVFAFAGIELGAQILLWAAFVMLACSTVMVGRRATRRAAHQRP